MEKHRKVQGRCKSKSSKGNADGGHAAVQAGTNDTDEDDADNSFIDTQHNTDTNNTNSSDIDGGGYGAQAGAGAEAGAEAERRRALEEVEKQRVECPDCGKNYNGSNAKQNVTRHRKTSCPAKDDTLGRLPARSPPPNAAVVAAAARTTDKVNCPLCNKSFAPDKIEAHAAECEGPEVRCAFFGINLHSRMPLVPRLFA
jgi:hypothetical protein